MTVLGSDIYDARPQPGDSVADSWARALFAAHEAFRLDPSLRGDEEGQGPERSSRRGVSAMWLVTVEVERASLALHPEWPATLKDRIRCAAGAEELGTVDVVVSPFDPEEGEDARILSYPPGGYADSVSGIGVAGAVLPRLEDLAADILAEMRS